MGVCVGDALGVPVEFTSRSDRRNSPVTTMMGYGTHNQPAGTWSDDSSLTFCLADSLCDGFSLEAIARAFIRWYREGYWTPHGHVFDIGMTTSLAISNLDRGVPPIAAGGNSDRSNGNGSLMRILPLAFYHKSEEFTTIIQRSHQVSCLTHAHPRSQMACGIYISMAISLLEGCEPQVAYLQGVEQVREIYAQPPFDRERTHFDRLLSGNLEALSVDDISSSGYVVHTLEASVWCLLRSSSYAEAVLKAVNLGEDTDTTAAVTGGLAGLYYGFENIPSDWVDRIARKADIIDLADRLEAAI